MLLQRLRELAGEACSKRNARCSSQPTTPAVTIIRPVALMPLE